MQGGVKGKVTQAFGCTEFFFFSESKFGCFHSGIDEGADLWSCTEAPATQRDVKSQ